MDEPKVDEVVKEKPPLDEPVLAVVLSDLEQGVGSKVDEVVKEKPPLQEFVEPEVTVITRWGCLMALKNVRVHVWCFIICACAHNPVGKWIHLQVPYIAVTLLCTTPSLCYAYFYSDDKLDSDKDKDKPKAEKSLNVFKLVS